MRSLMVISFLVGFVLTGCSRADRGPTANTKSSPPADAPATVAPGAPAAGTTTLSPLSIDDAEAFVTSWCGSGTLTNLRQLDADDYLVSDDVPAWILAGKKWQLAKSKILATGLFHQREDDEELARMVEGVKKVPQYKAMLPTGKLILADFSSGSGCRKTSIVIDALAAAYLKKLKDASSANALTCEKKSQGGFHRLIFKVPAMNAVLGEGDPSISSCHAGIAVTFVGHASAGTMSLVSESAILMGDRLRGLGLRSFIFEADGSAQFLRSDGVLKFFSDTFSESGYGSGSDESD